MLLLLSIPGIVARLGQRLKFGRRGYPRVRTGWFGELTADSVIVNNGGAELDTERMFVYNRVEQMSY
jgi:hypothetical protein